MEESLAEKPIHHSIEREQEARIIATAKRDPQAFGKLYDQYAPKVYHYLLSRLGNIEEARDITSQTFLTAVEMLPRYKHRGYFSAWLFSIARSKYVDYLRHRKNDFNAIQEEQINLQSDPLTEIIAEERMIMLKNCVHALAPEEQELLCLRFFANLTFIEIAELLKRNESTVKKRFYRLLVRLKNQLEA